jgi:hypothetical protein
VGALLSWVLAAAAPALAQDPLPACLDGDGDGYSACHAGCDATDLTCGDCNDAVAAIHPGAAERCNFIDDNCDAVIDDGLPVGRESLASSGYDCLDNLDNDGDGLADLDDPDCQAGLCGDPDPPGCAAGDPGGCCENGGLYQCTTAGDRICVLNVEKELHSQEGPFPAPSCFDQQDNNCNDQFDQDDPLCFGPEVCDGRDNDGDDEVDEGFDLGNACTVGLGFCARSGSLVCQPDGTSGCSVVPGQPTAEGPAGGASCSDLKDNDCDGGSDLADSDCRTTEVCDGLDNDGNGQVDEAFSGLGEPCTVSTGACQASGTTVCNPEGTGTVCNATARLGSPEGPAGPTCRDGIDNDCDGSMDAGDAGCGAAALGVVCALPYTHGAPGKDCTGKHQLVYSTLNASPEAVVTAELLALDVEGNLLATLPVQNGEAAHLKSRLGQLRAVTKASGNGLRHDLFAPVPLLRVTVEDRGHQAQAFCSNIPYLQVFEPTGDVVSVSEGDVTRVVAAIPRVDPASLLIKVDGVDILQALSLDPTTCTPDAPCGGSVIIHGHPVGVSELIVQSAPDVATPSANTVTMTLTDLGCGGHVVVVDGERFPDALPTPRSAQCHEDDIRDKGTAAVFAVLIDSPTPGQVTDVVPTPVVGKACHGRAVASIDVNGLAVSTSGQVFTPGDGEDSGDMYSVPIDVTLPQTDLAADVAGLATALGTFDRGSNRLVAEATDDQANRTFATRLFAVARADELTKPGVAPPVGAFAGPAGAPDFGPEVEHVIRGAVADTLDTLVASTDIPDAFALGITPDGLNTFFQSTCDLATALAEQKINEHLRNTVVGVSIPADGCSPNVAIRINSVDFQGSLTCNVTADAPNDKVVVHVGMPTTVLHGDANGSCRKKKLGVTLVKIEVSGPWSAFISNMRVDFDITETQIEEGGVSEGRFVPGTAGVDISQLSVRVGGLLGAILDIFNFFRNLFGLDDFEDVVLAKIQNAIREFDFTAKIGILDFPLTLKQIKMNEQEITNAKLKLVANVDQAEVAAGGLLLTLKASFFSTSTDPEIEDAPGALLTPAPAPVPGTPPTAAAGNTYFVVADDAFNQLFASLTTQGAFRTVCAPANKTVAELAPPDCDAVQNVAVRGGCKALKGIDCGTLPLGERLACIPVRNKMADASITPDMELLFCGRFDVPPQILIQDDPASAPVETTLRVNDALFSFVLDRNPDASLGGPLPTLPKCLQAGADTSGDCRLLAACLDLNLTTSLLLDSPDGKLKLVPRVEGLQIVPRAPGVACEGGISFGDNQLLQDAAASDPLQDLQTSVDTLTPALQSDGLDLGGLVFFSDPRLIAIETDGLTDFQDYVGVTGSIVPNP